MKHKVQINKIELFGYHGVLEDEKENGQNFVIDITYTFNKTDISDDISSTVDYSKICDIAKESFFIKNYDLLENLSHDIASSILNSYESIEEVILTVTKSNPPMNTPASSVSVSTTISAS